MKRSSVSRWPRSKSLREKLSRVVARDPTQYALAKLRLPHALALGNKVTVAVIDSAIDVGGKFQMTSGTSLFAAYVSGLAAGRWTGLQLPWRPTSRPRNKLPLQNL